MSVLYTTLKHLHVAVVGVSVGLFVLRGVGVLQNKSWPTSPTLRRASMGIDTVLLGLGLSVWWTLGVALTDAPWLITKLVLLVAYVLLGTWALRRARTRYAKAACLVLALVVAAQMATVAVIKHPLGAFAGWWG
jgi:uncharacterized membrane protein SirB2